jgi:aspartyl-tRNA(Asn)/glutamyl-tRNA(Gln) amidotransferase subunit B
VNENNTSINAFPVKPAALAALIALIDSNKLNFSTASTRVLTALLKEPEKAPLQLAGELNLLQDSDEGNVAAWIEEVLTKMPDKVAEYRKGKKGLMGLFVGEVKKISKGKADPKLTNDILLKKLQS